MRFLAFVTSDAEYDKIIQLLEASGIPYEKKIVRAEDQKAQGYILQISEKDFDRADELLSTPGHDFAFDILDQNMAKYELENERQKRTDQIRKKVLRRVAIYVGVAGMVYLIYALITSR